MVYCPEFPVWDACDHIGISYMGGLGWSQEVIVNLGLLGWLGSNWNYGMRKI